MARDKQPKAEKYNPLRQFDESQPPTDVDAEWSVISCLAMDGSLVDEIAGTLSEDDFYDFVARMCYIEAVELRRKGKKLDAAILLHRFRRNNPNWDDKQLSLETLREQLQCVPSSHNYAYYMNQVLDASMRRRMMLSAQDTCRRCMDVGVDPKETMNWLNAEIVKLSNRITRTAAHSMADIMQEALERQAERQAGVTKAGIPSGFRDLDEITCGLPPELIVLAARPSVGKTALAMQVAVNVADQGSSVLFVSLEMSKLELGERIMSWRASVPSHAMRNGYMTPEHRRAIVEQVNRDAELPLSIIDDSQIDINEITAHAMKLKRVGRLGLVVIDYLELIRPVRRDPVREREVAEICAGLKRLQKDAGVPVICLAQLNRKVEEGADRDPRLSDLRASGAIEQDAHQVWFLARKVTPDNPGEDRVARLMVAKNRNGRVGSIRLAFTPETSSFSPMAIEKQKEF